MNITGMVAIGNGEPCPWCKKVLGKDFTDASAHFQDNHPDEFMKALFGDDK